MKKTMMKLLSVVMALMMLFGCCSTLVSAVDVHEHDKLTKLNTVAPRCNAYGYTLYICSCGETWATDIVAKTEGIHSLDVDKKDYVKVDSVAPSCEADGTKSAKACSWCGKILEGGEKSGDKTGHNYEWVLVPGDCNNAEEIVYKCTNKNCENKDKAPDEVIELGGHEKDGHNFVYNITKYPVCELVADSASLEKRVVNGELVYGYKLEKTNGTAEYECLDCGVKYTGIVVEWNDHVFAKKNNGKVDNCTDFYAEWTECLECGLAKDYVKVDRIKAHDFKEITAPTCDKAGSKKCQNADCGLTLPISALGHNKAYICDLAECKAAGVCNDCTHENRVYQCQRANCEAADDATFKEHAWGTQKYYSYIYYGVEVFEKYDGVTKFCTPATLYVCCENEACEARKVDGHIDADPTNAKHGKLSYIATSEYFEASCVNDGYIMVNCLMCLQGHIKLEGQAAKDFIDANIVELDAAIESGEMPADQLARATTQLATLKTLAGKAFIALGHRAKTDDGVIKTEGYAATCIAKGLTDKFVCNRDGCTYVIEDAKEIAINPNNHTTLVKIGQTIEGTCTTPETTYYKCQDCEHTVYEKGNFNYFNHTKYFIDETTFTIIANQTIKNDFVTTDKVAVVCGVSDGNRKYQTCKLCANVVSVQGVKENDANENGLRDEGDTIYTVDSAKIDKAHTFVDVEGQKETCTADGWNKYQNPCTRCGAASPLTKKVIPAHGDNYAITIDSQAYAPECIKPGVAAGRYCAECDTINGVKVADSKKWNYNAKPDLKNPTSADPWYIAPLGHGASQPHMVKLLATELSKVTIVKGECVRETFGVRYCTYCVAKNDYDVTVDILLGRIEEKGRKVPADAWVIYNLVEAVDHVYPEAIFEDDAEKNLVKNVTDNFTGVSNFDNCVMDKEYYVTCQNANCTHTSVAKTEAAKGHYYIENGKEVVIDTTCTEIAKYADWTCADCGKTVGKDIVAKHSIVEVIEQPGCEKGEHGRRFWACELCDARYFRDDSNPYAEPVDPKLPVDDSNPYVETIYVNATNHDFIGFATEDGELTEKYFKPATFTEDGYVYRVCSKCGIVKETLSKLVPALDVALKAEKDTIASGDVFKVDITYSGEYVEFNALQIDLYYDTVKTKFLKEQFDKELPAGVAVKEENNGKIVVSVYSLDGIAPAEGETISLYFRSRSNYDKTEVVYIDNAMAFGKDGAVKPATDLRVRLGASAKITSLITGELNGYAGINAGDAIVMMDLIYAKQYNSQADLDKNGTVDVADFALLSKLIATDGSDKGYNECISENLTASTGIFYARVS